MNKEIETCHNLCREHRCCEQEGSVRYMSPLGFGSSIEVSYTIADCLKSKNINAYLIEGEWTLLKNIPKDYKKNLISAREKGEEWFLDPLDIDLTYYED